MNVETVNWHQCPIGREHERKIAELTSEVHAEQDAVMARLEQLTKTVSMLTSETSKLNGKMTMIVSIVIAISAAGFSFIFDLLEEMLKHHVGG